MKNLMNAIGLQIFIASVSCAEPQQYETPAPSALSFDDARKRILSEHPALSKARAEFEASLAKTVPVYLSPLPEFSLLARKNWADLAGDPNNQSTFVGASAKLNLFRGGADYFGIRAASALREEAKEQFQGTQLQIEAEAVQTLFSCILEKQNFDIAKARHEIKTGNLDIAKARYSKGYIPDIEVEKLAIDTAQSAVQLDDAEKSLLDSKIRLKQLLPRSEIQAEWPWKEKISLNNFFTKLPPSQDQNVHAQPSFRAAEAHLDLSNFYRSRERAYMFPSLDLGGTYGRDFPSASGRHEFTAILTLSFPLFDHLKRYSSFRAQSLSVQAARMELELQRRLSLRLLETTTQNLNIARSSALEREKTLDRARKLFDRSQILFKGGHISVNDLRFDEDRWHSARFLAIQGWASAHNALMNYCHARGQAIDPCIK